MDGKVSGIIESNRGILSLFCSGPVFLLSFEKSIIMSKMGTDLLAIVIYMVSWMARRSKCGKTETSERS
jgi:hypothetical protein